MQWFAGVLCLCVGEEVDVKQWNCSGLCSRSRKKVSFLQSFIHGLRENLTLWYQSPFSETENSEISSDIYYEIPSTVGSKSGEQYFKFKDENNPQTSSKIVQALVNIEFRKIQFSLRSSNAPNCLCLFHICCWYSCKGFYEHVIESFQEPGVKLLSVHPIELNVQGNNVACFQSCWWHWWP